MAAATTTYTLYNTKKSSCREKRNGINYKTGELYGAVADHAGGLMPELTLGFGEGIKAFFGAVDDALVYIWS